MDLQLNEHGRLLPESVDEVEPDELSTWIRDRLHDRDQRVSDSPKQDIGQYYLVGAIYDDLALSTQADVRRALKQFLREMDRNDDQWTGRPAHTLLLLTKDVGEHELAAPVRRMAENGRFLPDDKELHGRLLQTLLFLSEKMTSEFWEQQLQLDATHFGVYAFAGLRMHSLPKALGCVLNEVDFDEEDLQARITTEIRGLLASPQYTRDHIRETITTMRDFIPDDGYSLLQQALPELELPDPDEEQEQEPQTQFSEARRFFGRSGDLRPNDSLELAGAE